MPVWLNILYDKEAERHLSSIMRIVSGTLKPIPVQWLANIRPKYKPPKITFTQGIRQNPTSSSQNRPDLEDPVLQRFIPGIGCIAKQLRTKNSLINQAWENSLSRSGASSSIFGDADRKIKFGLLRKKWCILNRIRSSTGRQ